MDSIIKIEDIYSLKTLEEVIHHLNIVTEAIDSINERIQYIMRTKDVMKTKDTNRELIDLKIKFKRLKKISFKLEEQYNFIIYYITEPVAAEPVAAEPVAAEPVAAEPVAAEPVAAAPEPVDGDSIIADISKNKKKIDDDYELLKKLENDGKFKINCTDRQLESDLSKRPFFLFYGKPFYMINYHYIWINNKPDEDDKILNMIRKYSYPSCLAYDLTAVEKAEIRENEYFNIKNKIERSQPPERKVKIIQIPRILYDLYNIIYRREHFLTMDSFVCNLDMGANPADNTFDNFKTIINEKTNKVQQSIINMNDRFVNFLGTYNLIQELIKPEISTEVYLQIFDILYEKIVFNSSPGPIALARMASDTFHHLTRIESFDNIFNKRFKTILFQTLLIELGFIYDSTNDKYILNKESDIMILYRGYSGNILSTFNEPRAKAHSNSFNTSILNGIIHDQGANTYNYMKAGCDKAFYLIKKHFYSDKTDVNNIFFIPPIHPFLLLYGSGEYWHARSKIHIGAPRAIGLATTVSDFIQSSLPKDELEAKFQEIVKPLGKILLDKYYAKYLKYKQKYLSLKNIEK